MTDRSLRSSADLDGLHFAKHVGLVPAIAQDVADGRVLMMAFANREALERSLDTGEMHFWSRSRGVLWRKGETSGNTLRLVSLHADCDGDAVLALVRPAGPACHTGEASCFGDGTAPGDTAVRSSSGGLEALDAILAARQAEQPAGSYTVRLLDDENLRLKKLGEETAELVAALAKGDPVRAREEAADLVYHALVALRAAGVTWSDVAAALHTRHGGRTRRRDDS